ncbi:hypothetical protein D3C80_2108210 [compost metagenome]
MSGRHKSKASLGICTEAVEIGEAIAKPHQALAWYTRPKTRKRHANGSLGEMAKGGFVKGTQFDNVRMHGRHAISNQ